MSFQFVVHLSKAWRSLIPRDRSRTVEELAEEIGKYVLRTLVEHSDEFPEPKSLRAEFVRAYYTPMPGAQPWEWWDQVLIEFDVPGLSLSQAQDLAKSLEKLLPENTHIGV